MVSHRAGDFARRLLLSAAIATAVSAGWVRLADAHPLHTTLSEVTVDPSGRTIHVVIRVFADDFGRAVARAGRTPVSPGSANDAAGLAYVQRTFVLAGRDGRALTLRTCGVRRTGDLLWICVEAGAPAGVTGTRVRNAMLCDLYDDQVNIVRVTSRGATNNLLFTRSEPAKPLT